MDGLVARLLTRYDQYLLRRAPILIENTFGVDSCAPLSAFRPKSMTTLHVDFRTDFRCRGYASTNSEWSVSVCGEELRGIRARRRCPGPVAILL